MFHCVSEIVQFQLFGELPRTSAAQKHGRFSGMLVRLVERHSSAKTNTLESNTLLPVVYTICVHCPEATLLSIVVLHICL